MVKRVVWDRQQEVGDWVHARVGGTFNLAQATAIGQERDGQIIGGCTFENYLDRSVFMNIAGDDRGWLSPEFLASVFGYCFNQLKVQKVLGQADSANVHGIQFHTHLGAKLEAVIKDAARLGDLHIYSIARNDCRFLGEKYVKRLSA